MNALYQRWVATAGESPEALNAWEFLEKNYQHPGRHYHNFGHLSAMFEWWDITRAALNDPEAVAMAIWYHDVVYEAGRSDNESRSASAAEAGLTALGWEKERIQKVSQWIKATKNHLFQPDDADDLAWLLDYDLAILGAPPAVYDQYALQIRREFAATPDWLFFPGRKTVLEAFLKRENIFKTDYFKQSFEISARENLNREIQNTPGLKLF